MKLFVTYGNIYLLFIFLKIKNRPLTGIFISYILSWPIG